jgi:pimeloyl-ACP methyl ester carboxylesterase
MSRFVFIHGSWHGAWSWCEIVPRLRAQGHDATAIDLPGHGEDRSPAETVRFEDYVDRTTQALNASPENAILVGHSMGGGVISQVADLNPGRVRALVYVAALIPPGGHSMMSFVGGFDPEYLAQILWAPDGRTARISPEGARDFLYTCCSPEIVELVYARHTPEPITPFETPIAITEATLGSVPRYYIECLRDRVVPIGLQRTMRADIPFAGVCSLDTDHSPFFSKAEDLTTVLHGIAEKV